MLMAVSIRRGLFRVATPQIVEKNEPGLMASFNVGIPCACMVLPVPSTVVPIDWWMSIPLLWVSICQPMVSSMAQTCSNDCPIMGGSHDTPYRSYPHGISFKYSAIVEHCSDKIFCHIAYVWNIFTTFLCQKIFWGYVNPHAHARTWWWWCLMISHLCISIFTWSWPASKVLGSQPL